MEKVPGGWMVVPLMLGALLNTLDQAHLGPMQRALEALGAEPFKRPARNPALAGVAATVTLKLKDRELAGQVQAASAHYVRFKPSGSAVSQKIRNEEILNLGELRQYFDAWPTEHYEFLRIGGFTEPLFKAGAMCLIALFLVCVGAQMNPRVGGRALKKGLLLMTTKWLVAVGVAWLFARLCDPFEGWLKLSTVALIAAIANDNGGLYVALTKLYGNRSDVGAIAVISINDGPFMTLLGLGILGAQFPFIVFAAVLIPVALGMILGNLDHEMREVLAPGEQLLIPFFAFALGAGMDFRVFFNPEVVGGGVTLGLLTVLLTVTSCSLVFRMTGERSVIGAAAECSTAGNAAATPAAVGIAAAAAGAGGWMDAAEAARYVGVVNTATLQVSISVLATAILCPLMVILMDKWQRRRGIDGRLEK
jgi:2-keto-3-deoxygluconate permease